ncbi:MAG: hypothetical protein K2X55_15355 [Burkholderiaceae bacterium]|nr:hypothetical protein [Burkholderiaceae bacterium]
MTIRKTIRMLGRGVGQVLWPWPSIKRTFTQMNAARQHHADNLAYIRDLLQRSRGKVDEPRTDGDTSSPEKDVAFEQFFGRGPASLARIAKLKRLFLFQKRLALAAATVIFAVSVCAIANGAWLAIATILSSGPMLFMASLTAQFRLWQLRNRRLSRLERGGLKYFFIENRDWVRQVLDPEFSAKLGE